ncbi:suppressor APC domain-containing protein 2 [Anopheles nili]|uniref:suppressor APC domain-containing protein 2 n=1 Tax=Anopheles nili TaxID=185578 RepID=UPI00237A8AAF|nr:suppressor APC domain-containing protein 2 [Anopheles nili]
MDPLSNRNRKNILSLSASRTPQTVQATIESSATGMATHLHAHRQQQPQQQQQPFYRHGQQHPLTHSASSPAVQDSHLHQQQQQQQHQQQQQQQQQHHHHHHHQHHQQQQQHVEGLPKAFVAAMRTLFDIMDDRKTGFVRLADIEERWQDDGSKGLPRGVIDSLRKVTPPNGLLSFERFCGGLKICLLRNQTTLTSSSHIHSTSSSPLARDGPPDLKGSMAKLSLSRPPSAPLLDLDTGGAGKLGSLVPALSSSSSSSTWATAGPTNTATVRPNNAMPAQKTLSMPQLLSPDVELDLEPPPIILPGAFGPPKPPRVSLNLDRAAAHSHQQQQHQPPPHHHVTGSSSIDKAEIRNALQNWQMSLLMGEAGGDKAGGDKGGLRPLARGSADGQTDLSTSSPSLQSINQLDGARLGSGGLYQKKSPATAGRRREPRRHTLQNGVDYNMLKRLKQIEQEKDILLQGLTAVEKTRDWYLKQLTVVQEKMRYLGRPGSHMETWTETQQERLDLQRARVLEVNRHLMMLAESWERGGFPMHMNLALRPLPGTFSGPSHYQPHLRQHAQPQTSGTGPPAVPPPPPSGSYQPTHPTGQPHHLQQQPPEMVTHLKQQNHQLVEEINQKNEKMSLLEREKAALIRELLQLQRANRNSSMISNTEELVF